MPHVLYDDLSHHDDLVDALIEGNADRATELTEAALRGGQ